jgi:glutamyl-tRNA reductase
MLFATDSSFVPTVQVSGFVGHRPMGFLLVGMNHRTAPVDLRERLAIASADVPRYLADLVRLPGVREAAILSTCNRVEVIAAGESDIDPAALDRFLAALHHAAPEQLADHLYAYRDAPAATHLFEVAASIDSLVVGETEILGQVKTAYQLAQAAGTAGRVLHASFQHALHVAKAIHASTRLGSRRVSVGSVAVEFAEKIFQSLVDKTVLIIGAGEMAEATARTLRDAGARDLRIANRTSARAEDLAARVAGRAVPFDRLEDQLAEADVVLSCAGAADRLLGPPPFARALRARRYRPIVAIDIAVPRSIDPAAGQLDHLYLFNIDDLVSVAKANLAARQEEIVRCRPLLDAEVRAWEEQLRTADLGPLIARMREAYQQLAGRETERILAAIPGLPESQRTEVEGAVRRLVGRFVHDQTVLIKGWAQNGSEPEAMKQLERLLDETRGEPGGQAAP